jgi:hypothetical protein
MPSRKRSGTSSSSQSGSKSSRGANGSTPRSRGSRVAGAGPRATPPGSGGAQRVAGKSAKGSVPGKKPSEQSPQTGRSPGKTRRRACVLCGRMFTPTPQSSSTRKYCSQCRRTNPAISKPGPPAKQQGATKVGRTCRDCGKTIPKSRKSSERLCADCEPSPKPAKRVKGWHPQGRSVRAILCGSPGLGKRR